MLDFSQINSDTLLALAGGGGLGWLFFRKLMTAVTKEQGEVSAYTAMEGTVKSLQTENERLHKTVQELQGEVAKLHIVIADLTHKLTTLTLASENSRLLDELAKEGKIDRRNRRD